MRQPGTSISLQIAIKKHSGCACAGSEPDMRNPEMAQRYLLSVRNQLLALAYNCYRVIIDVII